MRRYPTTRERLLPHDEATQRVVDRARARLAARLERSRSRWFLRDRDVFALDALIAQLRSDDRARPND